MTVATEEHSVSAIIRERENGSKPDSNEESLELVEALNKNAEAVEEFNKNITQYNRSQLVRDRITLWTTVVAIVLLIGSFVYFWHFVLMPMSPASM